ncbi:MAG: beta-galactosidase [Armatimonadetes bacterium]|nr:beta-galactosidase [Armatimonadota bacterium]
MHLGGGTGWLALALVLSATAAVGERVEFARPFAPEEAWVKPPERPYRADQCLNGRWRFQPVALPAGWKRNTGTPPDMPLPAADGWDAVPIKIPSPWNVNAWGGGRRVGEGTPHPYWPSSLYYPSYPEHWDGVEMGWLSRSFTPPAVWSGRRLLLHFEAVAGEARVVVNGRLAGSHLGSHLPFECDITDLVRLGEANELLVGVRGMDLFDQVTPPYSRMRSPYPPGSNTDHLRGIWQDVWLLALPATRVVDAFVQPWVDRDELAVEATLRNDTDQPRAVTVGGEVRPWVNQAGADTLSAPEPVWRLDDAVLSLPQQAVTLAPGEQRVIRLSAKVGGRLKLWSPEAPNLYGLVLAVDADGQALDRQYSRFGWRQVAIRGRDLLLNGSRITLYGDLLHPFGPFVNSRRYVWAWYKLIKDMHGNAVRPHAQPHPRAYLDLADEMGLMVLDETAMFGSSLRLNFAEPTAWDRFAENYDSLVRRDRNHPSVFGWSWGNELFATFIYDKAIGPTETDAWYGKLAELGRRGARLDPTRAWTSCDGDEDVRGTQPVWNKHFGHGTAFAGDRAYESYAGRNEALAVDVYDTIVHVARPRLAFFSPAETAWFGVEPLPFGYRDLERLPTKDDGVWFGAYRDGVPGVQIERLPPYVCALNPGWDPALPLYRPLAWFHAQQAAQAPDAPRPCAWDHRLTTPAAAAAPEPEPLKAPCVVVDAATLTEARLPAVRQAVDAALAGGGLVIVTITDARAPLDLLNRLLPVPASLTARTATALTKGVEHPWTAGLTAADLYFAEDPRDKLVIKCGLGGVLVDQGRVLLTASNTDWSQFNQQPEAVKCGAAVLYEQLRKPAGAALVELASGAGRVVVSTLDSTHGSEAARALWERLLRRAGVKAGAAAATSGPVAFNAAGALINALVAHGPQAPMAGDAAWQPLAALGEDRYNLDQWRLAGAGGGLDTVWLTCRVYCPTDLSDPLTAGPDAPRVGLLAYYADELTVLVNGREQQPALTEPADYRKLGRYDGLPLVQGWNELRLRLVSAHRDGPNVGTLALRLQCSQPAFLGRLGSALR